MTVFAPAVRGRLPAKVLGVAMRHPLQVKRNPGGAAATS